MKTRTTLTIDTDLLIRFQEVAQKERRSVSSTINGWLQQVIEPAEFVAAQVDGDRQESTNRLRSLMGAVQVVNDQAAQVLAQARATRSVVPARNERAQPTGGAGHGSVPIGLNPPPCNTGGKVPVRTHIVKSTGGKSPHG